MEGAANQQVKVGPISPRGVRLVITGRESELIYSIRPPPCRGGAILAVEVGALQGLWPVILIEKCIMYTRSDLCVHISIGQFIIASFLLPLHRLIPLFRAVSLNYSYNCFEIALSWQ